ncbi:MAG: polyprenyl synthetase family protein [Flammeovirgaceae bacterium]|nr:polyprenyl synthetase family protein [Flammeovirgaceae bacterium]
MREEISTYLQWIEAEIIKQNRGGTPKSLYEAQRYILALGGKRVRPLLVALSYRLYKNDILRIIPFAVTVERFHNFTLIHDDIMDEAPLRRGKKTVHEKWDNSTAILAGDTMLVKVYDQFLNLEPSILTEALTIFNAMALEVCEGQQTDMEFEKINRVSEKEYINMIRQKTAVLLGFCMEFGALLAGAKKQDQVALRELGINIGIGFQLKDDLLDVYGNSNKVGKKLGGDILSNKKTFLLINALSKAKGKDKDILKTWINKKKFDSKEKVAVIKSIYDKLKIRELTEKRISEQFDVGFRSLESLQLDSHKKEALKKFIVGLIERQS